jgi:hypothetical protein
VSVTAAVAGLAVGANNEHGHTGTAAVVKLHDSGSITFPAASLAPDNETE